MFKKEREKAKKIRNSLTKHGHSYHHDHDHEEEYDEQKPKWHSEPGLPFTLEKYISVKFL